MGFISKLFEMLASSADSSKAEDSGRYQREERAQTTMRKADVEKLCRKVYDDEYVGNLRVGRSWVLPQMVHMGFDQSGQFRTERYVDEIGKLSYAHLWKILIRNMKAMQKMRYSDPAAYQQRARWWNKEVALAMANLDLNLLKKCESLGPVFDNCTGGRYVSVRRLLDGSGYCQKRYFFLNNPNPLSKWNLNNSKTLEGLYGEFSGRIAAIANAADADSLYRAVMEYYNHRFIFYESELSYSVPAEFVNAYAGDGAYSAMMTMVKHLNLRYRGAADMTMSREECLADIEAKAKEFAGQGLRLLEYCAQKFFDRSRGGVFDYQQYRRR